MIRALSNMHLPTLQNHEPRFEGVAETALQIGNPSAGWGASPAQPFLTTVFS